MNKFKKLIHSLVKKPGNKEPDQGNELNSAANMPSRTTYYILAEKCHGCGHCQNVCRFGAISGLKKQVHTIDTTKCMGCGSCLKRCRHGAVKTLFEQQLVKR